MNITKSSHFTDNSMVITRGKGVRVGGGKGGLIYGGKIWFDFGWWEHNTIYRSCIVEMHTETYMIL